uniref:Uncharacterized protein n=1 Tax=Arundo donax TaxID=35708 RepID=A0A0A9H2L6_ARUDO
MIKFRLVLSNKLVTVLLGGTLSGISVFGGDKPASNHVL